MSKKRILVIGDIMLDRHLYGDVNRISPEAPVPVIDLDPNNILIGLGAAANVAAHISNAGIECILCYKKCIDPPNNNLHKQFESMCIEKNIICKPLNFGNIQHSITIKERIWAGTQQICRVDIENKDKPSGEIETIWIKEIYQIIYNYNIGCVIFSDYDKGTLTDSIIMNIAATCKEKKIPTILDPKRPSFYKIKNLSIIKPNNKEVNSTNLSPEIISEGLGETLLVHTMGKDGMTTYKDGEIIFKFPTIVKPSEVRSVIGCGDSVCSILALSLYNNIDINTAIKAASYGAFIGIQQIGCYCLTSEEINKCFEEAQNLSV